MDHLLNLRLFVRLVEVASFSRTAAEMGMSPATITTHLAQLEAHLGVTLLQRNTRGLSVTDAGRELYASAVQLLQGFKDIETRFTSYNEVAQGRLRISAPPVIASRILVPELPEFIRRYPDIHVELDITVRFVDLIQEGIDCAIRAGPLRDSTLVARPLGYCRISTIASPDYLERHGEPDFPEALANHACIANISSVTGRPKLWVFHDGGADKELMISGPLTFRNVEAAVQAAVMGLGIAQTVSLAADELVKKGLLKEILPGWSALGPLVQLLYPKSLVPNLMLQSFIEFSLESIPKYLIPSAGSSASPQEKGGSTDGVHTDL